MCLRYHLQTELPIDRVIVEVNKIDFLTANTILSKLP